LKDRVVPVVLMSIRSLFQAVGPATLSVHSPNFNDVTG